MNIYDDIADYLAAQSLGTVATDIFVGYLPSEPDSCLALFPTGGDIADGELGYDTPTLQVRTRGADFITAYTKAEQVYSALQGLNGITLSGGNIIINCLAIQSKPQLLGRDEAQRSEFVQNYSIEIRNITTHRV